MRVFRRFLTVTITGLALGVAACSPPRFDDGVTVDSRDAYPETQAPAPPVETALLGGPPGSDSRYPPPAPPPAEPEFFEMAPIPNPPEKTARSRQARPREETRRERYVPPSRRREVAPVERASSPPPRPVANAPVAATPATKPPVAVKPVTPSAPAKLATPKPNVPKAPTPATTPEGKLAQALAPEVAAAKFALPANLPDRGQAVVTLTLPNTFGDLLATEAAKAGLRKDAETIDAQARLKGVGYGIAPDEPQTIRVRKGEPTVFTWLITEAGSKSATRGVLSADVGLELSGGDAPKQIQIGSVSAKAAPTDPTPNTDDLAPVWRNFALTIPLLLILVAIFALVRWRKNREAGRGPQKTAAS